MGAPGLTPRSVLARAADRLLHTTAIPGPGPVDPALEPDASTLHSRSPVVDLLVGSAIMRPWFLRRRRYGHADLPRLLAGGVDLIGLTVATRHPDLRGTYSAPFFWSQGYPLSVIASPMAMADALIERVEGWEAGSGGRFRVIRSRAHLADVGTDPGQMHAFLDLQGGHTLMGEVRNLERLHARGISMLTLAHVMDNALVGSSTGVTAGGLTGLGREVIAECERLGVVVDLAHMSSAGIHNSLPLLTRPFFLSHTGFTALAGEMDPWRRYSPGTRNISSDDARAVAAAGGVIGVTLSTWLLGGETFDTIGRAVDLALEVAGPKHVAIGSDMDGGLRMVTDAAGMPGITAELLRRGHAPETVADVMGGNALRVLREVLAQPGVGPKP